MRRPININPKLKNALIIVIIELFPTLTGLILALVFSNFVLWEAIYAIFGVILFLFAIVRNWNRDSKNFKTNKTIVEDKRTDDYKEYKKFQRTIWILGLLNCLLSYLVFLIFVK